MKTLNYITILLASLGLCISSYAQEDTTSTESSQSDTAEATTTTVTANYSSAYGTISISTKNVGDGVVHSVSVAIPAGTTVSTEALLKSLDNAVSRSTEEEEEAEASAATILAISQAIEAMVANGTFPSTISSDFNMDLNVAQDGSTFTSAISLSSGDTSMACTITTVKNEDGSYSVTGNIDNIDMDITVASTEDSYIVSGEVGDSEVKATVSNITDVSVELENSVIQTEDANGNVVNTKVSVNNEDGTHTVTETNSEGETTTTTYEGNTTTPYDESTRIDEPAVPETNVEALGGVGEDTVNTDPSIDTSDTDITVPDSTIVTPEEFVTPEN